MACGLKLLLTEPHPNSRDCSNATLSAFDFPFACERFPSPRSAFPMVFVVVFVLVSCHHSMSRHSDRSITYHPHRDLLPFHVPPRLDCATGCLLAHAYHALPCWLTTGLALANGPRGLPSDWSRSVGKDPPSLADRLPPSCSHRRFGAACKSACCPTPMWRDSAGFSPLLLNGPSFKHPCLVGFDLA